MKWIALIVFGSVGAAALVGGLRWGTKRYRITSSGLSAAGVVVDQVEHEPPQTSRQLQRTWQPEPTFYNPLVEFETEQGETVRVEGSTGGGHPVLETGTHVTVVYDPADPSQAVILDFKQAWLGPLVLSVAGAIFLAFGVGGYFALAASDRRSVPIDQLIEQGRREMQMQQGPEPMTDFERRR